VVIFADGACAGNPGPGGWGAIVATSAGMVRELGGASKHTTNNRMELEAVIEALGSVAEIAGKARVYTDSVYVINGITRWIWGWRQRGWKTLEGGEVANAESWKALSALVARRAGGVDWRHVRGHSGVPGNERVDAIAVGFRDGRPKPLYRGPLASYTVPIHETRGARSASELASKSRATTQKTGQKTGQGAGGKAYSYLSLIGGVPQRHSTWAECERRVKGQQGARFRKALSAAEEEEILRSWGVRPGTLASPK
jgi:ribonuclease HI